MLSYLILFLPFEIVIFQVLFWAQVPWWCVTKDLQQRSRCKPSRSRHYIKAAVNYWVGMMLCRILSVLRVVYINSVVVYGHRSWPFYFFFFYEMAWPFYLCSLLSASNLERLASRNMSQAGFTGWLIWCSKSVLVLPGSTGNDS